jgi:2-aminoadipate transaminase
MDIGIERDSDISLYMQIRNQIREAILRGDITEGHHLPPERHLAARLGVNRTTVVNAYRDLAADGLVEGHVGRGTIVSWPYVEDAPNRPMAWAQQFVSQPQWPHAALVQEVAELAAQPGVVSFAGGIPTPELYPMDELRQACRDFLLDGGVDLLANCPTEGFYPLRQWLAGWLAEQEIETSADHILITSGSTQGLDLVCRALIEPDDEVIVEIPTSMTAHQCLYAARSRFIGVPLGAGSTRLETLQETLNRHRPKFIYVLPTFQNPTGLTLSSERRARLLSLAQEYGVPVIEDDPYSLLSYEELAPAPLKALDRGGHVVHLGTFSKLLFPGLRLGWIVAPEPVIARLARIKRNADLFTNTLAQGSAWHLLQRFDWSRYLEGLRVAYRERRDVMVDALRRYCPPGLHWQEPGGGFYLWVCLPEALLARNLLAEAHQTGVSFLPGDPFCVDGGGRRAIRLNFSYANQSDIEEGIKRLGQAMSNLLERQQEWPNRPTATRAIV